jgi:hypothetical protein
MRRGYGGGFRDELVTQSLTTVLLLPSAFDEVTEFGYFEYCGLGSPRREADQSLVVCAWDTETGPPLFTQLRMIFTCSLRQATVRAPWGRRSM